jgi:hypothetical protein
VVVDVYVPRVPVTVSEYVPGTTALPTFRVSTDAPDAVGENEAVTPLGRPETLRLTLPVRPSDIRVLTMIVPDIPWPMLRLPVLVSSSPGALIVREAVVLAVTPPDVPVMVMRVVPGVALALTETLREASLVVGLPVKVAVTPLGNPETAKATDPVNPYLGTTVMTDFPVPP